MKDAKYWIEKLNLQVHPEGGYFSENYRSHEVIAEKSLPDRYKSERCFGTSIYFLLTPESVSNFHRLKSDEIWHFHKGGSAIIHMIYPEGELISKRIGDNREAGDSLQVIIPHRTWFAAEVLTQGFILVGCTVSPGFEFEDFELADRQVLIKQFPKHANLISAFTSAFNS